MILFKQKFVGAILSGQKVTTRRSGERRWLVGATHQCRTSRHVEPFAVVRIVDVYQQRLGAMTDVDAKREGLNSLNEFKAAWESIYGRWNSRQVVWVVDFELV